MIYFCYRTNQYHIRKSGMNKYNTLFGQLLSQVKRPDFDKLCRTMNSDKYRKGFSTWEQFGVMTFAQITGQNGLRSIENALNNQVSSFYHLGFKNAVKRSTISYANQQLSSCLLYPSPSSRDRTRSRMPSSA